MRWRSSHYDTNVEEGAENDERDNNVCDRGVDLPCIPQRPTGEEDNREHDGEVLDGKVRERSFLEAVATAFDHRSSEMSEVSIQPLFS